MPFEPAFKFPATISTQALWFVFRQDRLLFAAPAGKHPQHGQRLARDDELGEQRALYGISVLRVVDQALQLQGGLGVVAGETVERLYREVRALRIYEGTSEIQQLIIAGQVRGAFGAKRDA